MGVGDKMKISGLIGFQGLFYDFFSERLRRQQPAVTSQPDQAEISLNREVFTRIRTKLAILNKTVAQFHRTSEKIGPLQFKSRARTADFTAANATSASKLGDLGTGTATVMTSTEEVNATPTSFFPFGPTWTSSTAQATIGGSYDGSNGTMTLTFKVSTEGTHGVDHVRIQVLDDNMQELEEIFFNKNHPIDQQYTLSNGLIITLGEGDLLLDDTFTVDVDDSIPMSFSPSLPQWIGSTGLATLDGVYDGSNGSMTLTFEVDVGGTHGVDDITIKVYDDISQEIDEIFIDNNDPIDTEYTLSNGLVFTLGDGDMLKGSTFTADVSDVVGSTVDPNKPLNGTRNDNPNLEYGLSVTDGSFELNGTVINVYASDTINTVLNRITQSSAGVTATFNAATETIVLTQKTLGSVPTIVLANDTSGFLAAMKLDSATPTPGIDGDPEKPLKDVARFSSVQSGNININGVAIAIDVNVDSLNDVLDNINASDAGVTASYLDMAQRVTIVSNDPNQDLILDSGGTGFFTALEISDGTYEPVQSSGGHEGMPQWYAFQFAHEVKHVAEALNDLFEESETGTIFDEFLKQLRQKIETAIQKSFGSEESHYETQFGVNFDFRDKKKPFFDFSEDDLSRLASALIHNKHSREIRNLFNLKEDGFVTRLEEALKYADSDLETTRTDLDLEMTLGVQESMINVWA